MLNYNGSIVEMCFSGSESKYYFLLISAASSLCFLFNVAAEPCDYYTGSRSDLTCILLLIMFIT